MNKVNLVPLHRQLLQARRARCRGWCAILVILCASLAVTYAVCRATLAGGSIPAGAHLATAAAELSRANSRAAALTAQLQEIHRREASARSISEQPDFSALLALLSKTVNQNIVLDLCELTPTAEPLSAAPQGVAVADVSDPRSVTLTIGGFGRTQSAVDAFVLDLESQGLFDRVTLLKSTRQPLLGVDAAAFRVECLMQPARGGAH